MQCLLAARGWSGYRVAPRTSCCQSAAPRVHPSCTPLQPRSSGWWWGRACVLGSRGVSRSGHTRHLVHCGVRQVLARGGGTWRRERAPGAAEPGLHPSCCCLKRGLRTNRVHQYGIRVCISLLASRDHEYAIPVCPGAGWLHVVKQAFRIVFCADPLQQEPCGHITFLSSCHT